MGGSERHGAILHTTDGGAHWTSHAGPLVEDWTMISVATAHEDNVWAVGHGALIVKSTDGGDTWAVQQVPANAHGFYLLRISALDPNTAWVTGGSAFGIPQGIILHTDDGGATWTRQDSGQMTRLWDVGFAGERD